MPLVPSGISVKKNSIALIGWEEGHPGQIHAWIERETGVEVACFVNPSDEPPAIDIALEKTRRDSRLFNYPTPDSYRGRPLVSALRWAEILVELGIRRVLVADSHERPREAGIAAARAAGLELINAIHPTALVLEEAVLHENVILHPRAVIGYCAELYDGVLVNIGSQLDHHAVARACSTLDPGVVTASNVTLGERAHIHTGAVIKNRVKIGADAIVGAGAVVIRDVPDGVTVVGNPARILRRAS